MRSKRKGKRADQRLRVNKSNGGRGVHRRKRSKVRSRVKNSKNKKNIYKKSNKRNKRTRRMRRLRGGAATYSWEAKPDEEAALLVQRKRLLQEQAVNTEKDEWIERKKEIMKKRNDEYIAKLLELQELDLELGSTYEEDPSLPHHVNEYRRNHEEFIKAQISELNTDIALYENKNPDTGHIEIEVMGHRWDVKGREIVYDIVFYIPDIVVNGVSMPGYVGHVKKTWSECYEFAKQNQDAAESTHPRFYNPSLLFFKIPMLTLRKQSVAYRKDRSIADPRLAALDSYFKRLSHYISKSETYEIGVQDLPGYVISFLGPPPGAETGGGPAQ